VRCRRTRRAELTQQAAELSLNLGKLDHRHLAARKSAEGQQHQQWLVHGASVALLPDAHAVKRGEDFIACHGQYFALSGSIQRTPPRGSGWSPA